jgi:Flp pilus assembly pilin Flp
MRITAEPSGLKRRLVGLRRLARDEEAIAITEYGMLVAFLAIALIAVVVVFGGGISSWFASKTSNITTN